MVKVGLIGRGFIGKMHMIALRRHGIAEIVAVSDKNPENLKSTAKTVGNIAMDGEEFLDLEGIATYEDGDELLKDPNVEAVVIALPTFLHKEYILKAIAAGKHIFCEKPLVRNTQAGQEVLDALKGYDKVFFVGHCIRFWPAYVKAHELIRSGEYGKVLNAHFFRNSPKPTWSWQAWLQDDTRSGGCILDLHIHDVDYVNYVFGKPDKIRAAGVRQGSEGISGVVSLYEYDNGPFISLEGNWAFHPSFPFRMGFRMLFENATIEYHSLVDDQLRLFTSDGETIECEVPEGDGYVREHQYFFNCIERGEMPSIVTPQSSFDAVALVEEEIASMK
jgi:predicted dehydrogenase